MSLIRTLMVLTGPGIWRYNEEQGRASWRHAGQEQKIEEQAHAACSLSVCRMYGLTFTGIDVGPRIDRKVLLGDRVGDPKQYSWKPGGRDNGVVFDLTVDLDFLFDGPELAFAKLYLRRLIISPETGLARIKASLRSDMNIRDLGTPICSAIKAYKDQ